MKIKNTQTAVEYIAEQDKDQGQGWSEMTDELAKAFETYSALKCIKFASMLANLVDAVEKLNLKYSGTYENIMCLIK
jgi:hypothetical protein